MVFVRINIHIAIDGAAGTGKSVLGAWVARRLRFNYLDTGLFYRAVAWVALQTGVKATNHGAVNRLLAGLRVRLLAGHRVQINHQTVPRSVLVAPDVSRHTALLAQQVAVRDHLTAHFRQLVAGRDYVVVGRDIASQVLPAADLKLFITALPAVRVTRRLRQTKQNDTAANYHRLLHSLQQRDGMDRNRPLAPLTATTDSIIFDNSHLTLSQAKVKIEQMVCAALQTNHPDVH